MIVVDARGRPARRLRGRAAPAARYARRPEIAAALDGRREQLERRSQTLGRTLLATAVPVVSGGRTAGAVRVTQSVDAVERAVRRAWIGLALIGLLVLGLGLVAGSVMAGQIARPVRRLDRAARRVAEGDLSRARDGRGQPRSSSRSRARSTR